MTTGAVVLIAAVAAALAFGLWRGATDGRFRGTHRVRGAEVASAEEERQPSVVDGLGVTLGDRATLLQFSSAFCAPCRSTRRTLAEVASLVPGVVHVELDAEHHLDVVRRLGILRTPTTLVLDPAGAELTRAAGAPSRDQVLAALGATT